jgi:hypothetical protein
LQTTQPHPDNQERSINYTAEQILLTTRPPKRGRSNARIKEPLDNEIEQDYPRMINKITQLLETETVLDRSDLPREIRYNVKVLSELGQIPIESLRPRGIPDNVISLRR